MSSLAIEGNTLSEDQISDIIDGKAAMGPPREILEAKNALSVYDIIDQLKPTKDDDLTRSHEILMRGLTAQAGKYRRRVVDVCVGQTLIQIPILLSIVLKII